MMRVAGYPSLTVVGLAVALATPARTAVQGMPSGCFDVDVTAWEPAMPKDSIQFVPPMRVRFDGKIDDAGRLPVLTAPGALGSAHSIAFATMNGKGVEVVWSTGYHGSKALLHKVKNGWVGSLSTFADYKTDTNYSAAVRMTPVKCDAPLSAARRYRERFSGTVKFKSGDITVGRKISSAPVRLVTRDRYVATQKPVGAYASADSTRIRTNASGVVRFLQITLPANTDFDQQLKRMAAELGRPTSQGSSKLGDSTTMSASWASRTLLISLVSVNGPGSREVTVLMSDPQSR